jgi:signal transduction histidine kinase
LLTNAVTYSPPETRVRATCRGTPDAVILEVHNLGEAIPADAMPGLFEPFKRGRERHGAQRSIGLGLYIVKHLSEAHGGRVEVESQPGQGTTFRVILPRA